MIIIRNYPILQIVLKGFNGIDQITKVLLNAIQPLQRSLQSDILIKIRYIERFDHELCRERLTVLVHPITHVSCRDGGKINRQIVIDFRLPLHPILAILIIRFIGSQFHPEKLFRCPDINDFRFITRLAGRSRCRMRPIWIVRTAGRRRRPENIVPRSMICNALVPVQSNPFEKTLTGITRRGLYIIRFQMPVLPDGSLNAGGKFLCFRISLDTLSRIAIEIFTLTIKNRGKSTEQQGNSRFAGIHHQRGRIFHTNRTAETDEKRIARIISNNHITVRAIKRTVSIDDTDRVVIPNQQVLD